MSVNDLTPEQRAQALAAWEHRPSPLPPDPCPYCGKPRHGLEDTVVQLANPMKFLDGLTTAQRKDTTPPFGPTSLHYDRFCPDALPTEIRPDMLGTMAPAREDRPIPPFIEMNWYIVVNLLHHGPGRDTLQLIGTTGWHNIGLRVTVNDTGSTEPAPWQTLWERVWGPLPPIKRGPRADRFERPLMALPAGNITRMTVLALQAPHRFTSVAGEMPQHYEANDEQTEIIRISLNPPGATQEERLAAAAATLARLGPKHAIMTLAMLGYWVDRGEGKQGSGFARMHADQVMDILDQKKRDSEDKREIVAVVRDLSTVEAAVYVNQKIGKKTRTEQTTSRLFDVAFTSVVDLFGNAQAPYVFDFRPGYWATMALQDDWRYVVEVTMPLFRLHCRHDAIAIAIGCYVTLAAKSRHGNYTYTTATLLERTGLQVGKNKGRFRAHFEDALATLAAQQVTGPVQCLDTVPPAADSDARHWWPLWEKARWVIPPPPIPAAVLSRTETLRLGHVEAARRRGRPKKISLISTP